MFKIKKKALKAVLVFLSCLLLASSLIPSIRKPIFGSLRQPLIILTLFRRELAGLVFYHRNYIQNEKLQKNIDSLKRELVDLKELQLENSRLQNLLYFKQKSSIKLVAARVIARSSDSWSSALIIDKGRFNGIENGMPAITYLGLAGRVIEVFEFTSRILLINDPSFGVSAYVQRSRQEGLISGTLGTNLILKYLPEEPDISLQDSVVTSGLNSAYPKGVLIGRVIAIHKEFSGLSRYAIVKPAVNLADLEEVLIVIQ